MNTELKLDLHGYTHKQYAALILREDLQYSHGKGGIRLGMSRYAFASLYRRSKAKTNLIYVNSNSLLLRKKT